MLRKRVGGAPTWIVVLTTSRAIEIAAEAVLSEVIPRAGRWLVLGPMRMPRITDPELARREPALTLISALIHAGSDDVEMAHATAGALHALEAIAPAVGQVSYDILRREFSEAALTALALRCREAAGRVEPQRVRGVRAGAREPSLGKFRELLAVVAPDLVLSVGPREFGGTKRKTKTAR